MSFIDLLSNDIWSDADITNRTEAMVRSITSAQEETILNRKVLGSQAGAYALTADDQAKLAAHSAASIAAQQEGVAARADMALLRSVMEFEYAMRWLDQAPQPELIDEQPNPLYEQDVANRAAAQAVIVSAPKEVIDLYALRNPEPADESLPV